MKRVLKVLLTIFIIFVLVMGTGIFLMTRGLSSGAQIAVNPIDLSSAEDGAYTGEYDSGRFSNELNINVKDHKITSIEIVKDVTFAQAELSDELFAKVIAKQNTDVDVITGGTVTSKAYLKSIENALSGK